MVHSISNFEIYDRWGSRVFQRPAVPVNLALDPAFAWDGYIEGELAPPGVYVFFAEVAFEDGSVELVKGDVTVVR